MRCSLVEVGTGSVRGRYSGYRRGDVGSSEPWLREFADYSFQRSPFTRLSRVRS